MIVIVEGIDKTGKTNFCKRLSGKTGISVFREPVDFNNWRYKYSEDVREIMCEKMKSMVRLLKETYSDVIFDRFHLSEWVYGTIERGSTMVSGLREIDGILHELGAKVIVFHPIDISYNSKVHGRDLLYHEEMYQTCGEFSKCDIINCTYLEIEAVSQNLSNEYREEMMKMFECESTGWGI